MVTFLLFAPYYAVLLCAARYPQLVLLGELLVLLWLGCVTAPRLAEKLRWWTAVRPFDRGCRRRLLGLLAFTGAPGLGLLAVDQPLAGGAALVITGVALVQEGVPVLNAWRQRRSR